MENSEIREIFDIIETYLTRNRYRVMDGDEDSVIIRSMKTGEDYEIKITELIA